MIDPQTPEPAGDDPTAPDDLPDDGIETLQPQPWEHLHRVEIPHELTPVQRFDAHVDRAFDRLRGREPFDRAFYVATELGDFGLIWLLFGGVRALGSDRNFHVAARLYACMGLETVLVNGVLKSMFKRERPVMQEERPYRIRIPLTTSFPSGHSSTAMLASCLLADGSKVAPAYFALGAVVASSRVYVKIHHASDVLAGLALGTALGLLARRLWRIR
jgi:undecaprenyl-diphosphatase